MIRLVNFCDLGNDDLHLVLQWRNHPEVRKWMYTDTPISLKEHLGFIDTLKSSTDRYYFLVFQGREPIGVIYFTNIDMQKKIAHFGLYGNPERKGRGMVLMERIVTYAFKIMDLNRLIAEVFSDNVKALHLYKQFGFCQFAGTTYKGQTVLQLKLDAKKTGQTDGDL